MGRAATGQPPAGLVSSVFCLSRPMGLGLVGFGFLEERESGIAGEKISFFLCLCASRGKRSTMLFKTTLSCLLFLEEREINLGSNPKMGYDTNFGFLPTLLFLTTRIVVNNLTTSHNSQINMIINTVINNPANPSW